MGDISYQPAKLLSGKKIAIVKDAACCFIYPANIDCLLEQGAELQYFSVLKGEEVPQDADALWIPGGYPKLHTAQLSVSTSWKSLKQIIQAGNPVLAECGGSMLLAKLLIDLNESAWPMVAILSYSYRMQKKLASLGYREDASGMKGHEFHYSVRECEEDYQPGFDCTRGDSRIRYKNLRASYIHWYFASCPDVMAEWLRKI